MFVFYSAKYLDNSSLFDTTIYQFSIEFSFILPINSLVLDKLWTGLVMNWTSGPWSKYLDHGAS